ncbi:MAG: quinone-dependent dihydroorotate dehydrogenase [Gammaproteobacteria bacterium]
MSFYPLLRRALFTLPPEVAHDVALKCISAGHKAGVLKCFFSAAPTRCPVSCLGLPFPNPVGLAAGLDKNGDYIDGLGALGFGFIEVGTVTPLPQGGNPKPRLFRLPEYSALINRMGFNNKGVDYLVERLKARRFEGIVGVNIGKNKSTSLNLAKEDYLHCLKKVYSLADYVTVNVSSPNTPGLRELQHGDHLRTLLAAIAREQRVLTRIFHRDVPILVKVAPDLDDAAIEMIAKVINNEGLRGVIATNTTRDMSLVSRSPLRLEEGGLSGKPVAQKSNAVLRKFRQLLDTDRVLVGVGGIVDGKQAAVKASLGADLLQVYTGFIYRGPALLRECVRAVEANYACQTLAPPAQAQDAKTASSK